MSLAFPSSPSAGDVYKNWQWDGNKWIAWHKPIAGLPGPSIIPSAGITWTTRTSLIMNNEPAWSAVTYGDGLFVAVSRITGDSDQVMTSPDGINWTLRVTPATRRDWLDITYGDGLFVAVALNAIMTSPDGINWTERVSPANNNWISIAYGNGIFVAVSSTLATGSNRSMTSSDGIVWTLRPLPAEANTWRAITFGGGQFLASATTGGSNRIIVSTDGINWTAVNIANWAFTVVAYGNGIYFAGASTASMTSPNGLNWTQRNGTTVFGTVWASITFGNGMFVFPPASPGTGFVHTSPDGVAWTMRHVGNIPFISSAICYGNNKFVAVSAGAFTGARVLTSP